jgi:hypothetical protein
VATDIPWLANTNEDYMPPAHVLGDLAGNYYFCEGIGLWTFTPPTASVSSTQVVMTSLNAGIEELVAGHTIAPDAVSAIFVAGWDRMPFYLPKATLTSAYPAAGVYGSKTPGVMGSWGVDYVPGTSTVGMINNNGAGLDFSGLSTDGGQTFRPFGGALTGTVTVGTALPVSFSAGPTGLSFNLGVDTAIVVSASDVSKYGWGAVTAYNAGTGAITVNTDINGSATVQSGSDFVLHQMHPKLFGSPRMHDCSGFAMSTALNMIFTPGVNRGGANGVLAPIYTTDGGVTWTDLAAYFLANYSITDSDAGWSATNNIAADSVTANKFYLAITGTTAPGMYVSTTSGATWTRPRTSLLTGGGSTATVKCPPGLAGHVWCAYYAGGINFSTNSGSSWTLVSNISNVCAFGFGKQVGSYPSILISGMYFGVWGLWLSTDGGTTFTQLLDSDSSPWPMKSLSLPKDIDGDKTTAGTWYMALSGPADGWVVYTP